MGICVEATMLPTALGFSSCPPGTQFTFSRCVFPYFCKHFLFHVVVLILFNIGLPDFPLPVTLKVAVLIIRVMGHSVYTSLTCLKGTIREF